MVDEKTAKQMVSKLKGSPGYPTTKFLLEQLGRAFMQHAISEDHATRAVSRCFERSHFCPDVQSLTDALEETPAHRERVECQICSGSGWYHTEMENNIHGSMICCTCSAGDMKRGAIVGVRA